MGMEILFSVSIALNFFHPVQELPLSPKKAFGHNSKIPLSYIIGLIVSSKAQD